MSERDLRMPALGLAAWAGGLGALAVPLGWAAGAAVLVAAFGLSRVGGLRRAVLAWLLVALVVGAAAGLRDAAVRADPVRALASRGAAVEAEVVITSDPVRLERSRTDGVMARGTVLAVTAQGRRFTGRAGVLVFGGPEWSSVELGSTIAVRGRLAPAGSHDLAATVRARDGPVVLRPPAAAWRAAAAVRHEIRQAVEDRPSGPRGLVPALVAGDDAGLDAGVDADFRTSGLTHLLAVSGTNLTLVVGFLLVVGRWCGVRGRWQYLLGALGIVGFVLVARTEPSVVRAAAMGSVALIAMGSNGRDRGARALGVAVVLLLLWDPWLATSVGFTLSVLATAGILLLAPGWRDALARWLPDWIAAAVAVPAAAQLVCTPVVATISGEVSLVAVVANLLVAPLVGPATVFGLLGGIAGLMHDGLGALFGRLAAWAAAGIIGVATHSARLPVPAVPWGTDWPAIVSLTGLCVVIALVAEAVLSRPSTGAACCVLVAVVVLVPMPSPGWPAPGWVLAVCDVGQGDALVVNAGPGAAVVVDAGPDPRLVDKCLDRLDVDHVPLLVLTHFHADHVDGLPGVYAGRRVDEVDVTALAMPASRADAVRRATGAAQRVPGYGETRVVGDATLQVIGPLPDARHHGDAADEGSAPNNASVVLLVEVRGVRMLLTGDVEPEAQKLIARSLPGLEVDVLKIPHHGSRFQDLRFLTGLDAEVAVASAGRDNDYGHPAPATLEALGDAGARVFRTDRDGDVLVVAHDGNLAVATRR